MSPGARLDVTGILLVIATVAWFLLAPGGSGAVEAIGTLALVAGGYVMGFGAARLVWPLLPAALVVIVAGVALEGLTDPRGPLGYGNANGIYFALAAVAALMLWTRAPRHLFGLVALFLALTFGLIPLTTDARASAAMFVLAAVAGVVGLLGRARTVLVASAGAFLVILTATIVLGTMYSGGSTRIGEALTERRLQLWHEALAIVAEHPLAGAGFGSFEELSATARSDRDARWAHNEFLQVGAEAGVPGLLLLIGLFVWGFARLSVEPASVRNALAGVALAATGIAASVDYVLHFAAVPLSAAVLLGAGVAPERKPRRPITG